MREIYTNHLIMLKERKKISFSALQEMTGISDSTLCRWFKGEGNPSVDELERVFEAMGSDMREVFADIGRQEMIASEKIDYKGADELLADLARREMIYKEHCEQRVAHQIELRQKLQEQFDATVATISREHDSALTKRDETYNRAVEYLKKLVDNLEHKNTELMERTKQAETRADAAELRADAAEKERKRIDERRHNVFWGMLALCFAMLAVGISIYPPWA